MKRQAILFTCAALLLGLAGCMKFDTYEVPASANGCKIDKMVLYANGQVDDTASFTWTGNNITKVNMHAFGYTVDYNGALVTKRTFFDPGDSIPDRYDQFLYNAANNYVMAGYELFERDNNNAFYRSDSTTFQFSGGFMRGFTQYERLTSSDPMLISRRDNFTYSGSNLTQIQTIVYLAGQPVDTVLSTVTVNGDPNLYGQINSRFWMVNPQWVKDDMSTVVYSLTSNAITQMSVGGFPLLFQYTADDKGNLSEVKENTAVSARLTYKCP